MGKLLEYALNQYQGRIDKLKQLMPNTIGYERLLEDIDRLQGRLDQLRKQIAEQER